MCEWIYTPCLLHRAAPKASSSPDALLSFPLAHASAWPQFDLDLQHSKLKKWCSSTEGIRNSIYHWLNYWSATLLKLSLMELSYWTCLATRWKAWTQTQKRYRNSETKTCKRAGRNLEIRKQNTVIVEGEVCTKILQPCLAPNGCCLYYYCACYPNCEQDSRNGALFSKLNLKSGASFWCWSECTS